LERAAFFRYGDGSWDLAFARDYFTVVVHRESGWDRPITEGGNSYLTVSEVQFSPIDVVSMSMSSIDVYKSLQKTGI
jgi:hypothetical protein